MLKSFSSRGRLKKLLVILVFVTGLANLAAHWELLYAAGYKNLAVILLGQALKGSSTYHLTLADDVAISRARSLLEVVRPGSDMRRLNEFSALAAFVSGDRQLANQYWAMADGYEQLLLRGDAATARDAYEDAREWYSIATRIRPEASPAWCGLGRVTASPEKAFSFVQKAILLDTGWRSESERVRCWFEFGVRLYNTPIYKWDEAFQAFEVVTQIGTSAERREVSEAYRHQGKILEVKVGPEAAQPYFARALKVDPDNPSAIVSAAQNAYRLHGDLSLLLNEFRRAIALVPGDKWIPVDIASFLASQNLSDAVHEFCSAAPLSSFEEEDFVTACRPVRGQ